MPKISKKPILKFDRLNERATSEFIPVRGEPISPTGLLPLAEIRARPGGNTRPIHTRHVEALAESITILGLITPLSVDTHGQLLAGGHRLAALHKIAAEHPELFMELFPDGVPVHRIDINASSDTVDALQIEVEENTQRRNFTADEIREAAKKLEAAGYERLRGRPRSGQKSLKRELASVFRLSENRIQQILNQPAEKGVRTHTFSPNSALMVLQKWIYELEAHNDPEIENVRQQMEKLMQQLKHLRTKHLDPS